MPRITRWAICGVHGLYVDQQQSRVRAIAEHVAAKRMRGEPEVSRWTGRALNAAQAKIWERCRRDGDRAIKITIVYTAPAVSNGTRESEAT